MNYDVIVKKMCRKMFFCALLLILVFSNFCNVSVSYKNNKTYVWGNIKTANAWTDKECGKGSYNSENYPKLKVPENNQISFAGAQWDILDEDSDTVTVVLDKESANWQGLSNSVFNDTGSNAWQYSNSSVVDLFQTIYDGLDAQSQAQIVDQTIYGSSNFSNAQLNYDPKKISGSDVNSKISLMSLNDVSNLKVSARQFTEDYWLSTPGTSGNVAYVAQTGEINSSGDNPSESLFPRPKLVLNKSTLPQNITSAKCNQHQLPQITSNGYKFDVVGANVGGSKYGIDSPNNTYVLLLANNSPKKFVAISCQDVQYLGKINAKYRGDCENDSATDYFESDLNKSMENAYNTYDSSYEVGGIPVVPRVFAGAGVNSDLEAEFWPLSADEAKILPNYSRVFGYNWWLRDNDPTKNIVTSGGLIDGVSLDDDNALRPAFYVSASNIPSDLFMDIKTALEDEYNPNYSIVCPSGKIQINDTCANPPLDCGVNSHPNENNTVCIPNSCPAGTQLQGAICKPIVCADNQQLQGSTCVTKAVVCNQGEYKKDDRCYKEPVCLSTEYKTNNHACLPVKVTSISLTVNKKKVTSKSVDITTKSFKISASTSPSNAKNKAVRWKTSSYATASVAVDGTVKIRSIGTTTITAEASDGSGKKATLKLTVTPAKLTKLKFASTAKKRLTVMWKQQQGEARPDKFYIQYRVKGTSKWYQKTQIGRNSIWSYYKAKSKIKYQVRIRSSKKVGKSTIYSPWSSVFVSCKIK